MRATTVLLACSLVACDRAHEPLGSVEQPVIYGADDREEVVSLEADDPVREVGIAAVAAMVPTQQIQTVDGRVELTGPTLHDDRALCEGARFAEQPVVAHCSAVLVGDDLVLTAGHCAKLCSQTSIVFGVYYVDAGVLRQLASEDVFDCVDVVADTQVAGGVDVAWLRLDRPAGRRPVAPSFDSVDVGDALALVSFPAGVPMKVDLGGIVTHLGEGLFTTSHDAFQSSSGGPLLDERGRLVGILGAGAPDLTETPEGCYEPLVASSDPADGVERATSVERAWEELCDARTCVVEEAEDGCSMGSAPGSARCPSALLLALLWMRRSRRHTNEIPTPIAAAITLTMMSFIASLCCFFSSSPSRCPGGENRR
jgi:hypothetical protein